ncbi:WD and tetratricopeptide repeats protein 1 [Anopheles funestus]|uniref:WD and tetratricopeptide repeats protein 1 n=1 Tax=Anopheles funestus TaxID=62324 RepID=UPI0020C5D65B|nr:WD and tetratricopeptide repeats protein 1 [Anopheles funestus]XP_049280802.1 WD and tetratricopeptide repeats protein 1 [Anopheles funestus]
MNMKPKQPYGNSRNVTKILTGRAYWGMEHVLRKRLRTAPQFVDNIELEAELRGHNGCVNCLQWSDNGRILASASDDFHVMLWDPFRHKQLHDLVTPHEGNIFSVKFLPKRNNSLLVTGAGDCKTFVFDVNRQNDYPIRQCSCHTQRVKRLATSPRNVHMFWSSGEDGLVLQHDLRQPHDCRGQDANVLIDLRSYVFAAPEVKCIAINPQRPEQLAIGANDIYARLYDRRMISPGKVHRSVNGVIEPANVTGVSIPKDGCVKYFCPGHLDSKYQAAQQLGDIYQYKAVTYLTFSPDGTELLANMGSDHIYLYDVTHPRHALFLELPKFPSTPDGGNANGSDCNGGEAGVTVGAEKTKHKFPPDVEQLKKEGNASLEKDQFLQAINKYTQAIEKVNGKDCAIFYLNRATALMKRGWYGDVYAAVRDCHTALRLDPHYVKAHFRLAKALLKLEKSKEAQICLEELVRRFPSYAKNPGILMLEKDIGIEIEKARHRTTLGRNPDIQIENYTEEEKYWRSMSMDYEQRYIGHCNTKTDIKEANYFGDSNYIVAGSDDGNFFIWDRHSGIIHSIFQADELIVNCVQPHPFICMLATSGIDHEVRLWSPQSPEKPALRRVLNVDNVVDDNQTHMQIDPFDSIAPDQAICRAS